MITFEKIGAGFALICEVSKFDLKTRFHCTQKRAPRISPATLATVLQTICIAYLINRVTFRSIPDAGNRV